MLIWIGDSEFGCDALADKLSMEENRAGGGRKDYG